MCIRNVVNVYALQKEAQLGRHINTFIEDVQSYLDRKFHITLPTQNVFVTTNQYMANAQAKETDLLVTWLFTLTQDYYNYKMASVIGIMVFIVCAVFTLVGFNFMIRGDKEGTYS